MYNTTIVNIFASTPMIPTTILVISTTLHTKYAKVLSSIFSPVK